MPDRSLAPRLLGLLAHTSKPRGSVAARDREPLAWEEQHRVLEAALHQAVGDPDLLGRIGAAAGRMGRDAKG